MLIIYIIQKRQYLQNAKRYSKKENTIELYIEKPVKQATKFFMSYTLLQEHCKTSKMFGLVEMTSGLEYLGYSLPKGQTVKLNFLVPCTVLYLSVSVHSTAVLIEEIV